MQRSCAAGFALSLIAVLSAGANWTEFRGSGATGIAENENAPDVWSMTESLLWKAAVPGNGWACPIVVGGRVFVATAVSDGEMSQESDTRWEVHCFDAKSGEKLWTSIAKQGKPTIGTHRANTYASETPVSDGEHVIVYFGMTGVFCYDLQGELVWSKDLGSYAVRNDWGTSSSPVIHEGKVFLQVDNEENSFLVALDTATGDEIWRKQREEATNWGSLVLWKNSVRTEVVANGNVVRSYDPATGEVLWEAVTGAQAACSSASTAGDLLLIGGSNRRGPGGLLAVKAGAAGDISEEGSEGLLWRNSEDTPKWASPLIYNGCVYLGSGRGSVITCLDLATGERLYRERLRGGGTFWASPFAFDDKIFLPADNGNTYVIKPGPQFELLGTNELEGKFWSSVAIADGAIYLRSSDTLYCVGN